MRRRRGAGCGGPTPPAWPPGGARRRSRCRSPWSRRGRETRSRSSPWLRTGGGGVSEHDGKRRLKTHRWAEPQGAGLWPLTHGGLAARLVFLLVLLDAGGAEGGVGRGGGGERLAAGGWRSGSEPVQAEDTQEDRCVCVTCTCAG